MTSLITKFVVVSTTNGDDRDVHVSASRPTAQKAIERLAQKMPRLSALRIEERLWDVVGGQWAMLDSEPTTRALALQNASRSITDRSLEVFLAYARDAGNWSGEPLVGGNVGGSRDERGNLTQLKQAGLIKTRTDSSEVWLSFTPAGVALAAEHNVIIDNA